MSTKLKKIKLLFGGILVTSFISSSAYCSTRGEVQGIIKNDIDEVVVAKYIGKASSSYDIECAIEKEFNRIKENYLASRAIVKKLDASNQGLTLENLDSVKNVVHKFSVGEVDLSGNKFSLNYNEYEAYLSWLCKEKSVTGLNLRNSFVDRKNSVDKDSFDKIIASLTKIFNESGNLLFLTLPNGDTLEKKTAVGTPMYITKEQNGTIKVGKYNLSNKKMGRNELPYTADIESQINPSSAKKDRAPFALFEDSGINIEELDVSNNKLTVDDINQLGKILKAFSVKKLNLSNNNFSLDAYLNPLYNLLTNYGLVDINLEKCFSDSKCSKEVIESLIINFELFSGSMQRLVLPDGQVLTKERAVTSTTTSGRATGPKPAQPVMAEVKAPKEDSNTSFSSQPRLRPLNPLLFSSGKKNSVGTVSSYTNAPSNAPSRNTRSEVFELDRTEENRFHPAQVAKTLTSHHIPQNISIQALDLSGKDLDGRSFNLPAVKDAILAIYDEKNNIKISPEESEKINITIEKLNLSQNKLNVGMLGEVVEVLKKFFVSELDLSGNTIVVNYNSKPLLSLVSFLGLKSLNLKDSIRYRLQGERESKRYAYEDPKYLELRAEIMRRFDENSTLREIILDDGTRLNKDESGSHFIPEAPKASQPVYSSSLKEEVSYVQEPKKSRSYNTTSSQAAAHEEFTRRRMQQQQQKLQQQKLRQQQLEQQQRQQQLQQQQQQPALRRG